MVKGRKARIVKRKVRAAIRGARRMPRRKLVKAYGQVSGKLVAVSMKKRGRRTRRKKRY